MSRNDTDTKTVEIPYDLAHTAYQELDWLIERTGGPEGFAGFGTGMTPLALAREKISRAYTRTGEEGLGKAMATIEEVGEATGEETAPVDPLTDNTFYTRDTLAQLLEVEEP